jgi:hypothetical protein
VAFGWRVIAYSLATGTLVRRGEFYAQTLGAITGIAVNEETGKIYMAVPDEDNGQVLVYQSAPPRYPLSVQVTGEGEVTSTPAGIACSTGECTHEFEGEVILTAANAGAGYEFAGWIGCERVSGATCTVSEASHLTAVFLKAGGAGAPGSEGKAGPTGPAGPAGEKGATGTQGPAGQIELVTCKKVKGKRRCTTRLVSGTASFATNGSSIQATLSRHGAVYAAGAARIARGGRMSLRLLPLRRLRPGRYTLTLIGGRGRHETIRRESFTLR